MTRTMFALCTTACVLFLIGLSWTFFHTPSTASENKTSESKKGSALTHLHCSACGVEMPYRVALEGRPCPQCSATQSLVATVGPARPHDDAGSTGSGRWLVFLFLMVLSMQGWVLAWVVRRRTRLQEEADERTRPLACHCPFCQRKIKYAAGKSGAAVCCPRCKTAFTLPSPVADQKRS